jgi:simple sugar transport system permease protein
LIIIFIILSALVILTLSYTTFGKKIINTGMSITASQYAGYSVKRNQIVAMLVSGGLAGVLGMMVYLGRTNSIPMNILSKSIPGEGFSGISVGLIAMSNP